MIPAIWTRSRGAHVAADDSPLSPVRKVTSAEHLGALTNQPLAVALLWVDWSVHARKSETTALAMVDHWNRKHVGTPLAMWMIDVSPQSGVIWDQVNAWLTSGGLQNKDTLMCGGAGSLVWVRSGQIVEHVVNANAKSVNRLLNLTEKVFGAHWSDREHLCQKSTLMTSSRA